MLTDITTTAARLFKPIYALTPCEAMKPKKSEYSYNYSFRISSMLKPVSSAISSGAMPNCFAFRAISLRL